MNDLVPFRPPLSDRILTTRGAYWITGLVLGAALWAAIPGWIRWYFLIAVPLTFVWLPLMVLELRVHALHLRRRFAHVLALFDLLDRRLPGIAHRLQVYRIDALIALGEREKAKALLAPFGEWQRHTMSLRGYYRTRVAHLYYTLGDADGVLAWCENALTGRLRPPDRDELERMRAWAHALKNDFSRARELLSGIPAFRTDVLFFDAMHALEIEDSPARAREILGEAACLAPGDPYRDGPYRELLRALAQLRLGEPASLTLERVLELLEQPYGAGPMTAPRLHLAAALLSRARGDSKAFETHRAEALRLAEGQALTRWILSAEPVTALPSPAAPAALPHSSAPPPAPRERDRA